MEIKTLDLEGLLEITPRRFQDDRGFFAETFKEEALQQAGIAHGWVQDNQSLSQAAFTLRGLHYQLPPFAQAKLVRVLRGEMLDVVVDIRKNSATFGKWQAVVLSEKAFNQLYVPVGFAHGFLTLAPETEVLYKVSAPYSTGHEKALCWNDPGLNISWGALKDQQPILSKKDAAAPTLKEAIASGDIFMEMT